MVEPRQNGPKSLWFPLQRREYIATETVSSCPAPGMVHPRNAAARLPMQLVLSVPLDLPFLGSALIQRPPKKMVRPPSERHFRMTRGLSSLLDPFQLPDRKTKPAQARANNTLYFGLNRFESGAILHMVSERSYVLCPG